MRCGNEVAAPGATTSSGEACQRSGWREYELSFSVIHHQGPPVSLAGTVTSRAGCAARRYCGRSSSASPVRVACVVGGGGGRRSGDTAPMVLDEIEELIAITMMPQPPSGKRIWQTDE